MERAFVWLIPVFAVLGAGIWYFSPNGQKVSEPPPQAASPQPPPIRYPIETPARTEEPLPPLSESDGPVRDAFRALIGKNLEKFFPIDAIIHRTVATIDNLPRDRVSLRLMPVKRVPGLVVTTGTGENLALSTQNATRYRPYVRLAEAVPTDALIAIYKRFYPLVQEQYENLGYPGKYFNDRLVEVIDHLLEAPDLQGRVLLSQSRVLYEFSDPKLERLSAGQKILLRMGRENALRVKAKLQEIRQAVVSKPPSD
jgi:hypothetical protein